MIDRIKGICLRKSPAAVVVEVGGLGLSLAIPLSSFEKLGPVGGEVSLLTHLHVREDLMELYGFSTIEERDLFAGLIKVSGVGPRMALAIQSRFTPDELVQVVADGDVKRLTTVKGIGRKTAERLMLELKNRLDSRTFEQAEPSTMKI
ncbi:MAG TPA: Holliday junction branch migration protein RuvA, partial [Bacteroidetes bacterium]|nr:Holliday junction branch migration protein RuvA [Bacteroidota bacterium]